MNKPTTTKARPEAGAPAPGETVVLDSNKLERTKVWGETDQAVSWQGAFALYGGKGGTTASSTIVYEIEPGKRLGWHTDATEERQYIIAGQGKLYLEDGSTRMVGREASSLSQPRSATISRIPARTPCARPPCSPRTSTR